VSVCTPPFFSITRIECGLVGLTVSSTRFSGRFARTQSRPAASIALA
jgi:hypothetical protein